MDKNHDLIKPHFDKSNKINLPKRTYLKAITGIDPGGYKDVYIMLFSRAIPKLIELKTLTSIRVLMAIGTFIIKDEGPKLNITQKQIGEYLGIAGAEVSKAIAELERVELILSHTRGEIVVNPKYLWKGSLAGQQEAIKELFHEQEQTNSRPGE